MSTLFTHKVCSASGVALLMIFLPSHVHPFIVSKTLEIYVVPPVSISARTLKRRKRAPRAGDNRREMVRVVLSKTEKVPRAKYQYSTQFGVLLYIFDPRSTLTGGGE